MLPVRYELSNYVLSRRNSSLTGLKHVVFATRLRKNIKELTRNMFLYLRANRK
jgi:hypothetical protein